jgi:hypothetical protein
VHRFLLPLLLAALAVTGGTTSARADASCAQTTNLVFYSTDTAILANALGAAAAPCTDYWISITPTAAGGPRGGPPISAIHALGPHFHALAELRPDKWATLEGGFGGWYRAGLEIRQEMKNAGYTSNDTWAVNEVGSSSNQLLAKGIFSGLGTARQDFRDWLRGLYTGDGTPDPGVVFAADPPQYTTDISAYVGDATSLFYSDGPFWHDMQQDVSFWGQETYADSRSAGDSGATLGDRAANLSDYYLHGFRLAAQGNDATAAARRFFAAAYTPLGNGSYRYAIPDPASSTSAFGYDDIGLPGMLQFISVQAYALRMSTSGRFGFAVAPTTGSSPLPTTAAERLATYQRIAAAIRDSASDPAGACTAPTGPPPCELTVAGGPAPNWRTLANTQEGTDVTVPVGDGVNVMFDTVSERGSTWFESSDPAGAPDGFTALGKAYDLDTTSRGSGPIVICLPFSGAQYPHVFRGGIDITTSAGCGTTGTLAGTVALAKDATPPVITPDVQGPKTGDWYTGDVTLSWTVSDAQSPVSTSGCETEHVTEDTTGTTFTCTATSDGGPQSASVVIRRDATAPTITCAATPSTLWPPNGKFVPVDVAVTVADAISGPAGFALTTAPSDDASGWTVGTADTSGLMRAERPGNGGDRIYSLTYTATDAAGNTAICVAQITVPHDERHGG